MVKNFKKNMHDDDQSLLESTVVQAWQGVPELKIDEKRKFLGTFAERVIQYMTVDELEKNPKKMCPKITEAMHNEQAYVVLVKGDHIKDLGNYIAYAQKLKLKFKAVSRPDSVDDIILVVASKKSFKNGKIN